MSIVYIGDAIIVINHPWKYDRLFIDVDQLLP
jgi:hypothetical protein